MECRTVAGIFSTAVARKDTGGNPFEASVGPGWGATGLWRIRRTLMSRVKQAAPVPGTPVAPEQFDLR